MLIFVSSWHNYCEIAVEILNIFEHSFTHLLEVVPVQRSKHRPWLTPKTLDIVDQKRDARLAGKRDEHRRLKGIYKATVDAKAKADLDELFYNALADEAEIGFRQNNLQPAFRAIKRLKGKQDNDNAITTPVARLDGCSTAEEVAKRWTEHYESIGSNSVLRAK